MNPPNPPHAHHRPGPDPLAHADLRAEATSAAEVVAPQWPLSSVIAVNPLAGFEDRPFEAALDEAGLLLGGRGHLGLAGYRAAHADGRITDSQLRAALERRVGRLDAEAIEILLADLLGGPDDPEPARVARTVAEELDADLRRRIDDDHADWLARWSVDPTGGDLWTAWRTDHRELAVRFPDDALGALADALDQLRVPRYARHDYLRRQASALPGWTAHLRWRVGHGERDAIVGHLAALTVVEAALVDGRAWFATDGPVLRPRRASFEERVAAASDTLGRGRQPSAAGTGPDEPTVRRALAHLGAHERALVWQDAYERSFHDPLLAALPAGAEPASAPVRADVAVVCCIDVRSEGLRRHLEAIGDGRTGPTVATYGYAGFFGLAARVVPVSGRGASDRCPVLLTPGVEIAEVGDPDRRAAGIDAAWDAADHHRLAPLALAEGAGWLAGPVASLRTAAPGLVDRLARRLPSQQAPAATTFDRSAMSVAAQADVVAALVRIGLDRPPRLVVLCGHDARSDNNPMASGLACGACGGHGGGPSARIVAAMANDPAVRAELAGRGIVVADDAWFLAAVHETTTDRVEVADRHLVPASHQADLAALDDLLDRAGRACAAERAALLPGRPRSVAAVRRRGRDWAEPVPELGLAGNAAFVVGPRSLTAGLDLERRCFLHSYDADGDADGSVLAGILTAPLVVAQWINAQYLFSTTDPEVFGSGTKAVHNVLGEIGVISGAGGDLRRGLPLQSVRAGDRLLHEPVRLLAVVEGRLDHVDAALASSDVLARLVGNGWIHLVARPPGDPLAAWRQRTARGWHVRPLLVPAPTNGVDGAARMVAA